MQFLCFCRCRYSVVRSQLPRPSDTGIGEELPNCAWQWRWVRELFFFFFVNLWGPIVAEYLWCWKCCCDSRKWSTSTEMFYGGPRKERVWAIARWPSMTERKRRRKNSKSFGLLRPLFEMFMTWTQLVMCERRTFATNCHIREINGLTRSRVCFVQKHCNTCSKLKKKNVLRFVRIRATKKENFLLNEKIPLSDGWKTGN